VRVRAASGSDAEAIERIRIRGWQTAYRHVFPAAELDGMEVDWARWSRRLERPPAGWRTFVAEDIDRVLGFASVGPSRDERRTGELYAIYVDPDVWASGVGSLLIERAEHQLAAEYAEATLWVLDENARARRFYEGAGWRADDARKVDEHLGIAVPEVRYRKRFRSARSRS
jgi:GNAT superfamily N-acetyltransferase